MTDPFELHPECAPYKKKTNDILALDVVRDIITEKMVDVRTEDSPRWGYDKHHVAAILAELIFEMEKRCQNG